MINLINSTADQEPVYRDDPYSVIEALQRLTAPRPEDERARALFDRLLRRGPDGQPIAEPALVGIEREARGLVVTGHTGAGKSTLMRKLLRAHPAFPGLGMPGDGCKILSVTVRSPATLKSLGLSILDQLGWPVSARTHEWEVWKMVNVRIRELGYLVVHLDEAQRVAQNRSPDEVRNICDTWITLLQQPNPVVLLLSGVDTLLKVVNSHPQCFRRFSKLPLPPLGVADAEMIKAAISAYCLTASIGYDFGDHLVLRLIHASNATFGISMEYTINAIAEVLYAGENTLHRLHFAEAYAAATGCLPGENPFLADEWSSVHVPKATEKDDEDHGDDTPSTKKKGKRS